MFVGFAPFLSLSKRESFLTISDQVAIAPGPGQYSNEESNREKIKGGSTLKNRVRGWEGASLKCYVNIDCCFQSRRFGPSSSVAPGPGAYSIKSTLPKRTTERKPTYPITSRNRKVSCRRKHMNPHVQDAYKWACTYTRIHACNCNVQDIHVHVYIYFTYPAYPYTCRLVDHVSYTHV